jgi:hypothetical protein
MRIKLVLSSNHKKHWKNKTAQNFNNRFKDEDCVPKNIVNSDFQIKLKLMQKYILSLDAGTQSPIPMT